MISPEILRRYPFFGVFDDAQLKLLAMLAEEKSFSAGETIYQENEQASTLYLLMTGSVDLYFSSTDENRPEIRREFSVGEVNPGEVFGIPALVEPYRYTATTRTPQRSQVIAFDAVALRDGFSANPTFAFHLMKAIAEAAVERLTATRVQLAAAWA